MMLMNEKRNRTWAPLFPKHCLRGASIIVDGRLLCGDCFYKHAVVSASQGSHG